MFSENIQSSSRIVLRHTFFTIVDPVTAVDIPPAESPARPHPGDVPDHLVVAPGVSPVVGELPAHARGAPGGPGGGEVDY